MWVIATRSLMFREVVPDPPTIRGMGLPYSGNVAQVTTTILAGPLPQLVPDWVRNNSDYKFAVAAGVIREFTGPSAP
jgi:hypothetical protein